MGSHGLRSEPSSRRVWGQRPGQPYVKRQLSGCLLFLYKIF
nr:MAG TPA: hypothetical protein [Caudoviricetes sp.]DAK65349.1 MAG TPA: hypothetical protein [Caudoviricetes sp.]DAQ80456.1 MAG TPA: hypothetical protein [Herelleviridae sp.]